MANPMIQIGDEVREMTDAETAEYLQTRADAIPPVLTTVEKLESVGLTVADLKTALGL